MNHGDPGGRILPSKVRQTPAHSQASRSCDSSGPCHALTERIRLLVSYGTDHSPHLLWARRGPCRRALIAADPLPGGPLRPSLHVLAQQPLHRLLQLQAGHLQRQAPCCGPAEPRRIGVGGHVGVVRHPGRAGDGQGLADLHRAAGAGRASGHLALVGHLGPEDRALLGVLLLEHDREAEVLHQVLVALEAGVAHGGQLRGRVAAHLPPESARHRAEECVHVLRRGKIHKCEPCRHIAMLLARHVEERVPVAEATLVQEQQELLPRADPLQMPDHDGRALVLAAQDGARVDVELPEVLVGDLGPSDAVLGCVASLLRGTVRNAAAALGEGLRGSCRRASYARRCPQLRRITLEQVARDRGRCSRVSGHWRGGVTSSRQERLRGAEVVELDDRVSRKHVDVGHLPEVIESSYVACLCAEARQVYRDDATIVGGWLERLRAGCHV
mmetsp:Transcript_76068/g.215575  ORF Transcript_76068/g.215575 Transcript_76068/m.215575 type:complete len:443 (+) Transcript_76068:101-1429(+)